MSETININEIVRYYEDKLQRFGGTAQGMDWKNEETQWLRFAVIARYIDFSTNPSVLDIGCGSGEFLNFCNEKKLSVCYKGLDVVPGMVDITNQRFGKKVAEVGELLKWKTEERFDYVIASGTFNTKLTSEEDKYQQYFYQNIERMYQLADRAVIFNCMTSHVDYRYDRLYYATADQLGEYAVKNLSRRFIIDHSYPLYEMTMAIFKMQ
ncbi:hypothetical protein BH11BAC1_BH11BAC1_21730 [soil metagenome]